MSERKKPLPKHNNYNYYECYAKVVLEELFPRDFVDLDIKDKPDLQGSDGNVGIEVTIADDQEAESLYVNILHGRVKDEAGSLKKIQKCGCKIENGILVGKTGTDSFSEIYASFKEKLLILNKESYRHFKQDDLFIFSPIFADDRMLEDAILHMQREQLNYKNRFHKVFVLTPGHCYCLDLIKNCYENIEVTPLTQFEQATRARCMVEGD